MSACDVRWCDNELTDHSGLHHRHLVSLVASRPRGATIGLRLESPTAKPWPVIAVGDGNVIAVVLTWPLAVELATAISDAAERHG